MEYVVEDDARKLYHAMKAARMKLISTRGSITYSRSARSDQHCSAIDLVFGGCAIASRDPQWEVVDVAGFETDHRVTQTTLEIKPNRATSTRFNWKKANKQHVRTAVEAALKFLGQPALLTISEVDKYAANLVDLLYAAITTTVPPTKPRTFPPDLRRIPK